MKAVTVNEVMTTDVVRANEDTPFKELVGLISRNDVSGIPIVDDQEKPVGVVTEADLLMAEKERDEPRRRNFFIEWFVDPARLERIERQAQDLRAADVMTRDVITVEPDMPLREAVAKLVKAGVKRFPVTDPEGRLVGIVSRRDMLAPFLRTDDDIRAEIEEQILRRTMWIDPRTVRVRVDRGVVRLEGQLDRKSTREMLLELVRRVDGVVGVEEELSFLEDDRDVEPPGAWGAPIPGALRSR